MKRTANGAAEETTARGTGRGGGAENQYEITLARASAKLQVIKRADKQMKQREARGAASPRRRGTKGDGRSAGREAREGENRGGGEKWRGSSSWAQSKYSSKSKANERASERRKRAGRKTAR